MGKKKRAELEKQKERFVNGAVKNGIQKKQQFLFLKKLNLLQNMVLTKVMLQLML